MGLSNELKHQTSGPPKKSPEAHLGGAGQIIGNTLMINHHLTRKHHVENVIEEEISKSPPLAYVDKSLRQLIQVYPSRAAHIDKMLRGRCSNYG